MEVQLSRSSRLSTDPPNGELRRPILIDARFALFVLCHYGGHSRRFQMSEIDQQFIQILNKIDECGIRGVLGLEIRAIGARREDIDQIAKAKKSTKAKSGDEQRQNVLRTYALEPLRRAIVVAEVVIDNFENTMQFLLGRQKRPHFFNNIKRLWPALMTIASNDVNRAKQPLVGEAAVNLHG